MRQIEREAQKRMAVADKLQGRKAQTTALWENDESGIMERPVLSWDILLGKRLPVKVCPITPAGVGIPGKI